MALEHYADVLKVSGVYANMICSGGLLLRFYLFFSVMGKAEGQSENWHGHVTALTVAPEFRRLGLAAKLMHSLEDISEKYVCCEIMTEIFSFVLYNSDLKYVSFSCHFLYHN